jgi:hypothetical protein
MYNTVIYIYLCVAIQNKSSVVEHYMYVVGKCIIYLYKISKQLQKRTFGKFFNPVSQRVQMNFIFSDNVHILCLSCNVKKLKSTAKLSKISRNNRLSNNLPW